MTALRKMPMVWGAAYPNGRDPCACCGRELKGRRMMVHVIDGGSNVLHPADEGAYQEDAGEMGFHPIGLGCARKFGAFAAPATI